MRTDIAKVTTEKERVGSRNSSRKFGGRVRIVHDPDHLYEDEVGGFHSSSRYRNWNNKSLSDVLNPLKGILRKNVGRPWDDLYSEFCRLLDRRGVSGYHIWSHLCGRFGFVTTTGLYEGADGIVYEYRAGVSDDRQKYDYTTRQWIPNPNGRLILARDTPVQGYYVHPTTGLLCYEDSRGRRRSYYSPFSYGRKGKTEPILKVNCEDGSYYEAELVGGYKKRFYAWFHYRTETVTVSEWETPVSPVKATMLAAMGKTIVVKPSPYVKKNEHFTGETVEEFTHFLPHKTTVERTYKRSVNRADMKKIREFFSKRVDKAKQAG